MQSIFNMIPADDQKNLPEDENTPEKRADKIWEFFGKKDDGNSRFINSLFKAFLYFYHHPRVHAVLLVLFFAPSQIKSQRENSFRV